MLFDQIAKEHIQAMKDKDTVKSSTLSFLKAQLKNHMIDNKLEKIEDTDAVAIIKKQIKQRQDSIAQFEQGGRTDLAEKEKSELAILKAYLPEEMPESEIKAVVDEVIKETGAASMKDMGAVMKAVMQKLAGKADNKLASDVVKRSLSEL